MGVDIVAFMGVTLAFMGVDTLAFIGEASFIGEAIDLRGALVRFSTLGNVPFLVRILLLATVKLLPQLHARFKLINIHGCDGLRLDVLARRAHRQTFLKPDMRHCPCHKLRIPMNTACCQANESRGAVAQYCIR